MLLTPPASRPRRGRPGAAVVPAQLLLEHLDGAGDAGQGLPQLARLGLELAEAGAALLELALEVLEAAAQLGRQAALAGGRVRHASNILGLLEEAEDQDLALAGGQRLQRLAHDAADRGRRVQDLLRVAGS